MLIEKNFKESAGIKLELTDDESDKEKTKQRNIFQKKKLNKSKRKKKLNKKKMKKRERRFFIANWFQCSF